MNKYNHLPYHPCLPDLLVPLINHPYDRGKPIEKHLCSFLPLSSMLLVVLPLGRYLDLVSRITQSSFSIVIPATNRAKTSHGTINQVSWTVILCPGVDRGMWNVLYLFLNHKQFEDGAILKCPCFGSFIQD